MTATWAPSASSTDMCSSTERAEGSSERTELSSSTVALEACKPPAGRHLMRGGRGGRQERWPGRSPGEMAGEVARRGGRGGRHQERRQTEESSARRCVRRKCRALRTPGARVNGAESGGRAWRDHVRLGRGSAPGRLLLAFAKGILHSCGACKRCGWVERWCGEGGQPKREVCVGSWVGG